MFSSLRRPPSLAGGAVPGSHLLWVAGHPPSLAEDRRAQLTEPGGFVLIDLLLGECVRPSSIDVLSLTCARPNSTTVGAELSARVGAHVYGGFRSRDPPAASGQGGRQPRSRHGAHRRRPDPHRPTPGKTGTRPDHGTIHARHPTLQFHSVPRLLARPSDASDPRRGRRADAGGVARRAHHGDRRRNGHGRLPARGCVGRHLAPPRLQGFRQARRAGGRARGLSRAPGRSTAPERRNHLWSRRNADGPSPRTA